MSRLDERIYLGVYWGERPESVEDCAARLRDCLRSMTSVSPLLSSWKPKGRSKQEAMSSAEIDEVDLATLLGAGVNRRDSDGTSIPELGFGWSAWNGRPSASASVAVSCGGAMSRRGVLNSFVVRLPALSDGELVAALYSDIKGMFAGVVAAWEPDWGVVTSHQLRETREWAPGGPVVGWMTYLGPRRDPTFEIGTPMLDGTLLITADDWESVDAEAIDHLAGVLHGAGALRPGGQDLGF